jgi:hypothetical protein
MDAPRSMSMECCQGFQCMCACRALVACATPNQHLGTRTLARHDPLGCTDRGHAAQAGDHLPSLARKLRRLLTHSEVRHPGQEQAVRTGSLPNVVPMPANLFQQVRSKRRLSLDGLWQR